MVKATVADMSTDMRQCLRNCLDCYEICLRAIAEALQTPRANTAMHVALLQDCADICRTHAEYLMRRSPRQGPLAAVCAEVCSACAAACREMSGLVMSECANVCEKCAESCERMARA